MGRSLALVTLALLATGCATRASYHRLTADVAAVRSEVTDLRQAQERMVLELARTLAQGRALDARLAELNTAHKDAVAEVAALRARLDSAEAVLRETQARAAAVAPPPPAPAPPSALAPVPEHPSPPAPAPDSAAEQAYQAALATFRSREYGQAVLDFVDFMATHPKHPLVANAQYWIGEAYYVQRDYRQAMAEFQKVLEVAPTAPKSADALLKIGLCHLNLRDPAHARQTWQRVIQEFPKSEAAGKARALLRAKTGTAKR
jgi:tol-pal system protein YbgF